MTARTLIRGLVVLSVVMLVPAGLAAVRPDDREGPIGVGGVAPAQVVQFKTYGTADTIVARIEAGLDAYGNEIAAVRPDDRAERVTPTPAAEPVAATADEGIEWSDPLVIAALVAVLAGGAIAVAAFAVAHRHGGPGTRGTPGSPTPAH